MVIDQRRQWAPATPEECLSFYTTIYLIALHYLHIHIHVMHIITRTYIDQIGDNILKGAQSALNR